MDTKHDGGSAFPVRVMTHMSVNDIGLATPIYSDAPGMSLRDYYAGQALPVILGRLYQIADRDGRPFENVYAIAASASQEAADAMLAARTK